MRTTRRPNSKDDPFRDLTISTYSLAVRVLVVVTGLLGIRECCDGRWTCRDFRAFATHHSPSARLIVACDPSASPSHSLAPEVPLYVKKHAPADWPNVGSLLRPAGALGRGARCLALSGGSEALRSRIGARRWSGIVKKRVHPSSIRYSYQNFVEAFGRKVARKTSLWTP